MVKAREIRLLHKPFNLEELCALVAEMTSKYLVAEYVGYLSCSTGIRGDEQLVNLAVRRQASNPSQELRR